MVSAQAYEFSGSLPPAHFNMARYCLHERAKKTSDKTALIVFENAHSAVPVQQWTYGDLDQLIRRISGSLLAIGLMRGDRILIRLDNCAEYAFLFFAAISAGIVPIPASSQLTDAEVDFYLEDSGAKAIAISENRKLAGTSKIQFRFTHEDVLDMSLNGPLAEYADTRAEDPAYLIYTSGTSSHPKGVLHAHRSAWGRRPMYRDWYDIGKDDVVLHAGAFNWTYTLGVGLTDPWANGATAVVYIGEKDTTIWPLIIKETKATIFAAVPTVYRQILKYAEFEKDVFSTLRHGLTAGESLPASVAMEWRERTGVELYEAFGMSEISTYISTPPGSPIRAGSPGRAQTGRSVSILPVFGSDDPVKAGEQGVISIHRSDPGMMLGYWNRPDEEAETVRGDWFLTGDIASQDEDGYFWLAGRADNMMNAMGYRVSPVEVEAVLASCPGVGEAAVVECDVRENVSIICAFVVRDETANTHINAGEIIIHAQSLLASYKVPREIIFVDSLPRTANGKVKHGDLRLLYQVQNS